jgi:hypothetical protein
MGAFVSISTAVRQRTARPSFVPALFVFSLAWLAALPSHAQVKGYWTDDVARDQSFARVLVVGISQDLNQRCNFERALAAELRSANTVALVSCNVMPLNTELTRETVEAAVAANDADAVLTTSLISKTWDVKQGATRDSTGAAYYHATDSFYGAYGTVVAGDFRTAGPLTTIEGAAHVTSKLYETRTAAVVYALDTKVRKIESRDEGLAAIVGPMVKKLRREGLIR